MITQHHTYGIKGQQAPELSTDIKWIDENGKETDPIRLTLFDQKFKVLYGFQSWCPACHSRGLPTLKNMTDALKENNKVVFFALQTVIEGAESNTFDKLTETQDKYELNIPFGHDIGNDKTFKRSSTMFNYKTGGTPWFIFIYQNNKVIFNDYHLNTDKAITYLQNIN